MFLIILLSLMWNCKENTDTKKPKIEEAKQEAKVISKISPVIKELGQFADLVLTDSTDVNDLIFFKEIDGKGAVTEIDMERAVTLYNNMTKRGPVISFPIFEIKDAETAILPIQGAGFGGAIWAKVLIDRNSLEIKKIAFDHKAESDGYGAAMTQTSFEDQFVGTEINLEQNTFRLQKAIEKAVDDGQIIDGISGATMTSQGVIEMMNEGLREYSGYLKS